MVKCTKQGAHSSSRLCAVKQRLKLAGGLVLGRHVQDAVGIDVEGDLQAIGLSFALHRYIALTIVPGCCLTTFQSSGAPGLDLRHTTGCWGDAIQVEPQQLKVSSVQGANVKLC